ncbi:MAG: hypothetical protein AB1499_13485 [Nitrospirota bacterium]
MISAGSETAQQAAAYMGHGAEEEFLEHLEAMRGKVLEVVQM